MSRWLVVHVSQSNHVLPTAQLVEGPTARQAALDYNESEPEHGDSLYVVSRSEATEFITEVTPAVVTLRESHG